MRPISLDGSRIGPNNETGVPARALAALGVIAAVLVSAAPSGATTGSLPSRLSRALHVPYVSFAASGAVVVDLATGRVVYAHNATVPLRPASNEKLAVTYAALTALGPDFRIETDVLGDGAQAGPRWNTTHRCCGNYSTPPAAISLTFPGQDTLTRNRMVLTHSRSG